MRYSGMPPSVIVGAAAGVVAIPVARGMFSPFWLDLFSFFFRLRAFLDVWPLGSFAL